MPIHTIETNDLDDLTKELGLFINKGYVINELKITGKTFKVTFKKSTILKTLNEAEKKQHKERKLLNLELLKAGKPDFEKK